MVSVQTATEWISHCQRQYGNIQIPLDQAFNRIPAEALLADRDLPPFNRVAMDGIALRHSDLESGCRRFKVHAVVAAGDPPPVELPPLHCFEIMTGAALPGVADTVVPYEQVHLQEGEAEIRSDAIKKGQNIHFQGSDKLKGALLAPAGKVLGPAEISTAASVGMSEIWVKALPRIAVFSSGDELVDVDAVPLPHQIRRSNTWAIRSLLHTLNLQASVFHLPDNKAIIRSRLEAALTTFDVVVLSGGISMGKFDFIPQVLADLGIETHFYKVKQRPGKPFWFGSKPGGAVVFALPGNPVSTFLCTLRYVLPWLRQTLGMPAQAAFMAQLDRDLKFEAPLQWFVPVRLSQDERAAWVASPLPNNGSGDFQALIEADAFLELPETQSSFHAGEIFPCWVWKAFGYGH